MIPRILRVAICLATGALLPAALYWAFLNTPESRALMLAVSATLLVALLAVLAIAVNAALLLALQRPSRAIVGPALRYAPACVLVALPVGLAIHAINRGDTWVGAHTGDISAWFIATLNWPDVTWLFQAESYVSVWLRWVVLPLAALALVARLLQHGTRALASPAWARAAWNWRTLLAATLAFGALVILPLRLVSWRPALPPTWIEPAVAGAKLLVVGAAITIGVAVVFTVVAQASAKVTQRR